MQPLRILLFCGLCSVLTAVTALSAASYAADGAEEAGADRTPATEAPVAPVVTDEAASPAAKSPASRSEGERPQDVGSGEKGDKAASEGTGDAGAEKGAASSGTVKLKQIDVPEDGKATSAKDAGDEHLTKEEAAKAEAESKRAAEAEEKAGPSLLPGAAGDYLVANYYYRHNAMDAAFGRFDEAREALGDEDVRYRYLISAVLSGNVSAAASWVEKGGVNRNRILPCLVEMADAVKHGKWSKLEGTLSRTAESITGEAEGVVSDYTMVPLVHAWYFAALGNFDQAVKIADSNKSKKFFSAPFVLLQKALMADITGRQEEADKLYAQAARVKELPYYYVRLIGNYLERRSKILEASELYDEYSKRTGQPYRFAAAKKRMDDEKPPIEDISSFAQGTALVMLETARILAAHDMYSEAMLYARLAEYMAPDIPESYAVMAQYYAISDSEEEGDGVYDRLLKFSDYSIDAGLLKGRALMDSGRKSEGEAVFNALLREFPAYDYISVVYADALRNDKRYAEAASLYEKSIDRVKADGGEKAEHWSLHFALAVCLERLNDWPGAEKHLRRALELQPKQPDVLNYLGYGWLERDRNLSEAKEMIERALSYEEGSPHITDSLGWAFFKMHEYQTAARLLESAAAELPQDSTINEHLGDAYWHLGRETEARFQWQRAVKYNQGEADVQKLNDKIKRGLAGEGGAGSGASAVRTGSGAEALGEEPSRRLAGGAR